MSGAWTAAAGSAGLVFLATRGILGASLEPHAGIRGTDVVAVEMRAVGAVGHPAAWDDLDTTSLDPGRYQVRFVAEGGRDGRSLEVPPCAGRGRVAVDGHEVPPRPGPLFVPLGPGPHDVVISVAVSDYERRIACGDHPRVGDSVRTLEGLGELAYPSPQSTKGGGHAVVYVPPGHDLHAPGALLVGLHPWNGSIWTYAAYAPLLRAAREHDVLLLMPSGLGNSLYTADAEDEVFRAIAAVSEVVAVNGRAVSLWGASMGGAGATTIGLHHPDRFAGVTSFFGDSKYDLKTYVRAILPSEAAAHLVNALDVADNALNLPVWLIHGEQDRISPIGQSAMLAARMGELGLRARFDRARDLGHSGALVSRYLPEVVVAAASARVAEPVSRVTYRSVRASDTQAYGVRIVRTAPTGDAYVEVERRDDGVHVRHADEVRGIVLTRGALGTAADRPPPIVVDGQPGDGLAVRWEP